MHMKGPTDPEELVLAAQGNPRKMWDPISLRRRETILEIIYFAALSLDVFVIVFVTYGLVYFPVPGARQA